MQRLDDPLPSITTSPGLALAQPAFVETNPHLRDPEIEPNAYIFPNFGEKRDQLPRTHDLADPVPAVTERGAGNLVIPEVQRVISEQMAEMGVDPRRLVFLDGHPHLLDIRFRMLHNNELARAMGFDDEETRYEFHGNVGEVTRQIGNAVPVNLAAALVKATLWDGR